MWSTGFSVQKDDSGLSFCCRSYFRFFTSIQPPSPLQVPLFDNGWLNSLAFFGPHYCNVNGSFYLFELMALTCPSVADFFFAFSLFWPPAAPTTGSVCERPSDSISGMWTPNLTCSNRSWWPVLRLQVLFSRFHLSPTAGPAVQPQVRSFISVLRPSLLVLNLSFYLQIPFSVFRLSDHPQLPILNNGLWDSSAPSKHYFWYVGIFLYFFELIQITCITIAYFIFVFFCFLTPCSSQCSMMANSTPYRSLKLITGL